MFTAQVLAVMISGPVILSDTRGPYMTEKECQARIVEIVETGNQCCLLWTLNHDASATNQKAQRFDSLDPVLAIRRILA